MLKSPARKPIRCASPARPLQTRACQLCTQRRRPAGRTDLVRHLHEKEPNTELLVVNARKAIDLFGGGRGGALPAPPAAPAAGTPPAGAAIRGAAGPSAATVAEIRALLQDAAARK